MITYGISFIRKKRKQLKESSWLLGICLHGFNDLKKGEIHWIDNGKYEGKKWFADPFILDYNDKEIFLLVEEFDFKVHRGRIAKLIIDREKWEVADCKVLLDLPTHLSFPMIMIEKGEVYVCPENNASGGWDMYRYNTKTDKLEKMQQLIDEKLTDATIFHKDGNYWILSTKMPHPNGAILEVWNSSLLTGPYKKVHKVTFPENTGRNAGMFFQCGDKLIRPAQESNRTYGHSISFQEVSIDDGLFSFNEIYRFYSPHKKYDEGTHTYNTLRDIAVIDVKGWRYPQIAKILSTISRLAVALHIKKPFVIQ